MKKFVVASLILLTGSMAASADSLTNKHYVLVTTHHNDIGEICPEMDEGQTLDFEFESNHDVEFNLHYHEGEKVNYPIKPQQLSSLDKAFKAPIKQTYCLMWKGLSEEASKIKVKYQILPKQKISLGNISEAIPVYQPQPEYPQKAKDSKTEGYVTFLLDIAPRGKATNIRVVDENPKETFTQVSMDAISRWMFKPKIIDTKPVEQKDMLYTINFEL